MLEKRKVLTALIGYILGVIMGLYCKISIVPFYIIFYSIYLILSKNNQKEKFKLFSIKRYFRYVKIIFTKNVINLIIIFSIISNTVILYQESRYENLYKNLDDQNCELTGIIISVEDDRCKVKITDKAYKNTYLYVYTDNTSNLKYGDKIIFSGKFSIPSTNSNYRGFNYKNYLKTLKIYGTISCEKISVVSNDNVNIFLKYTKKIHEFLDKRIEKSNLNEDEKSIIKGVLIGNKTEISQELQNNFSKSNISYILVISGMHISYIILISNFIFNKLNGKHFSKIFSSLMIFIYMSIIGFTPSIIRAGVTGIITIMSNFFYRQNDIWTDLGISLFLILLYNPYLILNVGLQLSFTATIGIIIFQGILKKLFSDFVDRANRISIRRNKKIFIFVTKCFNSKIGMLLQDAIFVTISATLMVIPIMLRNFNTISITSLIISVLTSFIIGPIVILGLLFIATKLKIIELILSKVLKILIGFSKWGSELPLNQIYFITLNILQIFIYYMVLFMACFIINLKLEKTPNAFYKRIKNIISFCIYKFNSNNKKIISIILIIILISSFIKIVPKDLKIYFIDVGQGDCTLIITPKDKSILIDGGGNEWSDYNVR